MREFIKDVIIVIIAMFVVGFGYASFASTGDITSSTYTNERINLGFELPEEYSFASKEELNKMHSTLTVGIVPVRIKNDMAVKLPGTDNKYSVHVVTLDSLFAEPLTPTEAIDTCTDVFVKYCTDLNATDVATKIETVKFCNMNTSMSGISYIVNGETNYILCHLYNIENGNVIVATYGHTIEEATRLMESFYYIEDKK